MSESATQLDYSVAGSIDVGHRQELIEALIAHAGEPVRLLGTGSSQECLPPPERTPTLLRVSSMNAIQRLEPDDLTCSVEPGLPREDLDTALAEHGLWLPCPGKGTLGGLFAADLWTSLAPGALSPRSLLLGLEGVLAEGLPFKSGARVVKSVAGFDLQKLFVGSRGRLLAATTLHLKLRPRPRALVAFTATGLDQNRAIARFDEIRGLSDPPLELWFERGAHGCTVRGALAGNADHVSTSLRSLELAEAADAGKPSLEIGASDEIVAGLVRPSHLPRLIDALPSEAAILVNGTGQFETGLTTQQSDGLLARCPEIPASAQVRRGAPERRGRSSIVDDGVARLSARLRDALDPAGMLQ